MTDLVRQVLTGHGVLLPLVAFLVVAVAVFLIASKLARHADAIADATGLGRLWIGTVLLAGSTSLPELTTDVSAAVLGAIDIGVGDLMGSTLANMLLLAVLDLWFARRRIIDQIAVDHVLVGTIAIVLTCVAAAAIAAGGWGRIGHVGIETVVILALYLFGMRTVYETTRPTAPPEQLPLGETSRSLLARGLRGFALSAVGLVAMAPLLVTCAEAIAAETGMTETFIGTLLVGFTTSFPEIAASVAAVRIGALDLAAGNIFGSNAFNMCILLGMDLAYTDGPVLTHVAPDALLAAQFAMLAVALGILSILARAAHRIFVVRVESVLIILTYCGAAWMLASRGA
jgi:cation:H+ antiporter